MNSSSAKPELVRNQGVLWVSSDDGRIKGYDWGVHDDDSFQRFLAHHGWTNAGSSARDNGVSAKSNTRVNVVQSNDKQNEFFFPGFIGMFMHYRHLPSVKPVLTNQTPISTHLSSPTLACSDHPVYWIG